MATTLHGIDILEKNDGGQVITTLSTSVIGLVGTAKDADASKFPLNTPVLVTNIQDTTALGLNGTLPSSLMAISQQCQTLIVVVRIEDGADIDATIVNATGVEATYTGVYALLTAETKLKYKPKILHCPFLASKVLTDNKPNTLTTALLSVADKLRAVAIIDGPNTTQQDAIDAASNITSSRGYMVGPYYIPSFPNPDPSFTSLPSSALVAGVIAATDNNLGFWYSLSNKVINGVSDLNRPVSFGMSDPTCEANLLNAKGVGTIIYTSGTYRVWGNKSLSQDTTWEFLCVRRVADTVYDSIEANILWAIDMPFSRVLIDTIESNIQNYLNRLKVQGAIIDGRVSFPKNINSKEELMNGHFTVDFDFEPPAPLERLTIRAFRNAGYYDELINGFNS